MASTTADWSQAPADILWNIIKRLPLADRIRFGGVCVPWRSTLAENRCGPAPQVPWLMLPGDGTGTNDGTVRFFSSTEKKDYRISLPEMCKLRCIGSSEGFLIYIDGEYSELHMLDPISGTKVDLPSITTLPDILGVSRDSQGRIDGYMYDHSPGVYPPSMSKTTDFDIYYTKAVLSPGSTSQSDTVVVIYACDRAQLAFARAGDKAWNPIDIAAPEGFWDVIFHNQLIYALEYQTGVLSIDLNQPSRPMDSLRGLPFTSDNSRWYLMVLSGELLQVSRYMTRKVGTFRTSKVSVRKMDSTSHKWVEVKSIGDHALFLGHSDSVSLSTLDFPELKPNRIYFTDNHYEFYLNMKPPYKFDVGVCNIEDGSMEPYYPLNSILNWPPPIWFTPNMRNLTDR